MMFENPEVSTGDLPSTDGLDWQKLHRNFARVIRLQSSIVLAVIAGGFAVPVLMLAIPGFVIASVYAALILVGGLIFTWPSFSVPRRGYVLRNKDILFRKGVIWRSITAVPFNRIQHVETSSTPFDRKFGLATLQLFTAGGSGGDLKIDGLGVDVAEQLRKYILDKVGGSIENA